MPPNSRQRPAHTVRRNAAPRSTPSINRVANRDPQPIVGAERRGRKSCPAKEGRGWISLPRVPCGHRAGDRLRRYDDGIAFDPRLRPVPFAVVPGQRELAQPLSRECRVTTRRRGLHLRRAMAGLPHGNVPSRRVLHRHHAHPRLTRGNATAPAPAHCITPDGRLASFGVTAEMRITRDSA